MADPSKGYGLIKRNVTTIQPKLSIFNDDSDDEDGHISVGKSIQREANKLQTKRQVKLNIQNALSEDPTVFEYDEIYDDMVRTKEIQTSNQKQSKEKKPQYIGALIKAAKVRKLEQERAVERKVQKERDAEGEKFADKDSFVTSAYKQKMLELQELEEKDRHEAQIEALTDVTKQKDLSGFYRNLYRQTLGSQDKASTSKDTTDTTTDVKIENEMEMTKPEVNRSTDALQSSSRMVIKSEPPSPPRRQLERQPRQFRKRQSSSSSGESSSDQERASRRSKETKTPSSKVKGDAGSHHGRDVRKARSESVSSEERNKKTTTTTTTSRDKHAKSSAQSQRSGKQADESPSKKRMSNSPEMQGRLRSPLRKTDRKAANPSQSSSKKRARLDQSDSGADTTPDRSTKELATNDENLDADDADSDSSSASGNERKKATKTDAGSGLTPREKLLALFKKRTVGDVFDAAVERYRIRKSTQQSPLVAVN